jgi:large subunit ribosomal protein L7/L12
MNERRWSSEVVDLGDRIAGLTLSRAAELRSYLEEVHGVKPDVGNMPSPIPDPDPVVVSVPEYSVRLDGFEPRHKIMIIKEVREILSLGLFEAKQVVESAPTTLKEGLGREEAEELHKRLTNAGAQVSLV